MMEASFIQFSQLTSTRYFSKYLMDGERILEAEPTIGYIHRAFEKIAENRLFTK
jgi:NADH:ubiquinone oxidoreductase subunit D